MLIACLWSQWTEPTEPDLRGFAAITDEPPADIAAAGHDRCIINLQAGHIDAWLTPQGRTTAELQAMLSDRPVSTYRHQVLQAA
jgi:putative SOS response-associated peptidase YedK